MMERFKSAVQTRLKKIREFEYGDWIRTHLAVIVGVLLVWAGLDYWLPCSPESVLCWTRSMWWDSFLGDIAAEFFGIGLGVVLIDRVVGIRQQAEKKAELIRDLKSSSRDHAVRAVDELREYGWLEGVVKYHGLVGANLEGSSFTLMSLESSDFSFADLKGASFIKASLEGSNFTFATLEGTSFNGAMLKDVNFSLAKLKGASFSETSLGGIDFSSLEMEGANFSKALLKGANFSGAELGSAYFGEALLEGANFSGAKLESAYFTHASLEGADFRFATLEDARFIGASLEGADFSRAMLEGASFTGAKLEDADFGNASLANVNFIGANFKGAKLDGAFFFEAELTKLQGWTVTQLQGAVTYAGAIMPDGVKLFSEGLPRSGETPPVEPFLDGPTFEQWAANYENRNDQATTIPYDQTLTHEEITALANDTTAIWLNGKQEIEVTVIGTTAARVKVRLEDGTVKTVTSGKLRFLSTGKNQVAP